jgi:hypothetical protein
MSQLAAARFGFAALVLAALTAGMAVAGVRLDMLAYADGTRLMIPAAGLGVVALGFALFWTVRALKRNDGAGRRLGLAALAGSLALLYPPLSSSIRQLATPQLYDVTTNTANPPAFVALLRERGPDANAPAYDGERLIAYDGQMHTVTYVLHDYHIDLLKPRAGFAPGRDAVSVFFWRDFEAVKKTGWRIVDINEREGRIEATSRSFWFGRISDIVVQVRRSGRGARTDIRSQSRHDQVDAGINAANVERFLTLLANR